MHDSRPPSLAGSDARSHRLFASGRVQVGWGGPPVSNNTCCFLFPSHWGWLEPDGEPPLVADATNVLAFAADDALRHRSDPAHPVCGDWFLVSEPRYGHLVPRCRRYRTSAATYLAQREIARYVRRTPRPDADLVERAGLDLAARLWSDLADVDGCQATVNVTRHQAVERTRALLASSTGVDLRLADVAREVGYSQFHLCRMFREYTGYTIHQYRTQLRLRQALEFLEQDRGDILGVALRLGFSGHSHFTRTFQQTFGVTPSRFANGTTLVMNHRECGTQECQVRA